MSELIEYVDPNLLKPDPTQPRKHFDEQKINQLANSFDSQGVIEPLEIDEKNRVRRGERRWRASLKKGLKKVPIRRKIGLSDQEWLDRQLIDDGHRKNLTPQERFWAYTTRIVNINEKANYTIDQIKKIYQDDYEALVTSPALHNHLGIFF